MKVLFVRHGESTANVDRIISNRDADHPLTQNGVRQAEQLVGALQGENIAMIYSSPVPRAQQTAGILGERIRASVQVADALREYDCGDLEEKGDEESWRLHAVVSDAWYKDQDYDAKRPGGESFSNIERRFVPFIDELRGKHDDTETVVLVGHGGTYRAMLSVVCENVTPEFVETAPMQNTVLIETVWSPTGLVCLNWDGVPVAPVGQSPE